MTEVRNTGPAQPLGAGHFYGETLNKGLACGLLLAEITHHNATRLPKHYHELAIFNLLLQGRYRESYRNSAIDLEPFSVIFHPPGIRHYDEIAPCGIRIFSIELENRWLERMREYDIAPRSTVDLRGSELTWLVTRLYRERKERDCQSPLTVEGLVMEMLALVAGPRQAPERRPPVWLSTVLDLLRAEFQRSLTVDYVASQIGIHPIHLSRVFRQFQKQTIGDYLHKLRIQFAVHLLAKPEIPLATVADSAGFADQSHFTRVFREFTGLTPAAFRNLLLPDRSRSDKFS